MNKIITIVALFMATILTTNAQGVSAKKEFNNTLNAYFETKNALAKDNASLASESVKRLIKTIDNFPVKSISAEQQAIWKKESEIIKKSALEIDSEKAIKTQRNSFWPLSTAMVKLAKAFSMNTGDVYVQYCPMAKKSWLNEVEAIQNPFYGSMMYDCGEVTETIKKQ
ncbi:DUF3347 domain-containing protein [Pedobacter sp. Du54]|uniref:DUF3347 domain-containing protein n=1 Tax=Pedobacter anseongensis TaxID=3133439 RepID=UPI0030B7249A